jgi:hypothetical protein
MPSRSSLGIGRAVDLLDVRLAGAELDALSLATGTSHAR